MIIYKIKQKLKTKYFYFHLKFPTINTGTAKGGTWENKMEQEVKRFYYFMPAFNTRCLDPNGYVWKSVNQNFYKDWQTKEGYGNKPQTQNIITNKFPYYRVNPGDFGFYQSYYVYFVPEDEITIPRKILKDDDGRYFISFTPFKLPDITTLTQLKKVDGSGNYKKDDIRMLRLSYNRLTGDFMYNNLFPLALSNIAQ